jgi:hypothetical protein
LCKHIAVNPAHDFPTTIRYARREVGSLEAISGANGETAQTFVLTKRAGR